MLRNYLKIALRTFFKERLFSSINVIGLAVGAAVALLIFLYVRNEWTYDAFHTKADRIHRVWVKEHYDDQVFFNASTPFIMGRELAANFPEIERVCRYAVINNRVKKDAFSEEESIHLASPTFLEMFDFPLLEGAKESALSGLYQVVLSPEMAEKYFGREDPVGQSLAINIAGEWQEYQVSGVISPAPANSSIQYDMLIPFENIKAFSSERGRNSWTIVFPETYVELGADVTVAQLKAKTDPFFEREVAQRYGINRYEVGFQPLTDIHLNNDMPTAIAAVSDWRYPYILSGIALLVLLLAGINYVTLAVGRSLGRAREVGVRKVAGANRLQLMQQFWSEALLVALISVGVGLALAGLALPVFNQIAGKALVLDADWSTAGFLLGLAGLLGLIAGIYPSLIYSGFSPIYALKDTISGRGVSKHRLLRGLVGLQFVLSILLLSCTFIMQSQMQYLQNKNLGFEKESMLILPYSKVPSQQAGLAQVYEEGQAKAELLRNELTGLSGVLDLTTSSHTFGTPGWQQLGYTDPDTEQFRQFYLNAVDYNYLPMMEIELQEGRNFSEAITTDADQAVIVNRTMARQFGWENRMGSQLPEPFEGFKLIGITENFNFGPLQQEIGPLMMAIDQMPLLRVCSDHVASDSPTLKMTLKLAGGNLQNTVDKVRQAWKKVAPEQPFHFAFMDDNLDKLYRAERRLSRILGITTGLAIFIACLGLFGMATLTTARRTKEIGVRKVLGASATDIVLMLNKRFTILILIANLIAAPIAFYLMQQWLRDFAYHVPISPWIFLLAGLLTLLISWLAVSYQSVRAAVANPVRALRYE